MDFEDEDILKLGKLAEKIAQVNINSQVEQHIYLSSEKKSPLSNIPSLIKGFVGRRDEIEQILRLKDRGCTAFVLWGMAGVGKTQLALKFIQKIKSEYEAHVKVDLKGLTDPLTDIQAMFEVIKAFQPETDVNLSDKDIEIIFNQLTNQSKTLILLENAVNELQCSTLNNQNCFLVVTSRENIVIDGGKTIKVDVLSENDAEDLLFSIAEKHLFKQRQLELAELVGRLPIALKPLAVLLQRRLIDIDDLIEQYKAEKKTLELKDPLQKGLTIRAVFSISERFLDEKLKEFWYQMGVFPADFDIEAAAFVSENNESDSKKNLRILTSKSLTELIELNLIEQNKSIELERYRLHDLIRDYTRDVINGEKLIDLQYKHSVYFGKVLSSLKKDTIPNLNKFDLERNNIESGFSWLRDKVELNETFAQTCELYVGYAQYILILRLHFRDYIGWLEAGLRAAQKLGDKQHIGANLGGLGVAYSSLGEYKTAIEFFKKSLDIARQIEDRRSEGANLGNLGATYNSLGEYRKAIEFYEQGLDIARQINDGRTEGGWLNNLGNTYCNLGEYRKAIKVFEQSLDIAKKIGDYRNENNCLANLCKAYWALQEYQKVIELSKKALDNARLISDLQVEGNSLNNLGNVYWSLGEYQEAIKYYEQALDIAREIGNREDEGADLGNLGSAYKNLGQYQKAMEFFEQALNLARQIGNRLGEGTNLGNLGSVYDDLGNKEKAKELYVKSISILEAIESPNAEIFRRNLSKLENKGWFNFF